MAREGRRIGIAAGALALVALAVVVARHRGATVFRLADGLDDVTVVRDVRYVEGSSNPKHRLDVYAPKGAKNAPVVHFVHGGYWVSGDKDFYRVVTGLYGSVGKALARRGIVTVVTSYRLAPEVPIDGIVDDVMAGLRWTEQHAKDHGGDPDRLFMMGHSAGGHLVALAGSDETIHQSRAMDPTRVRGYISLSAVWDVADMHAKQDNAFNDRVTYPVFGRETKRWAESSPIERMHAGAGPFLVAVGSRDYPYLIPQAERAKKRLAELGVRHEWLLAEGNDHDQMVLKFGAKDDNLSDAVAAFVRSTR